MTDEDGSLIRISGPGWEQLPDGAFQFLVDCDTLVSYVCLPKTLCIGNKEVRKAGWNSDRRLAYYLDKLPDLTDEKFLSS
jgi:hypothetical protein